MWPRIQVDPALAALPVASVRELTPLHAGDGHAPRAQLAEIEVLVADESMAAVKAVCFRRRRRTSRLVAVAALCDGTFWSGDASRETRWAASASPSSRLMWNMPGSPGPHATSGHAADRKPQRSRVEQQRQSS